MTKRKSYPKSPLGSWLIFGRRCRHEVLNYHDNWFTRAFVRISTTDGPPKKCVNDAENGRRTHASKEDEGKSQLTYSFMVMNAKNRFVTRGQLVGQKYFQGRLRDFAGGFRRLNKIMGF